MTFLAKIFGREKKAKGVEAVCGYKDSKGEFWDTFEEAAKATKSHEKEQENMKFARELKDLVMRSPHGRHLNEYDMLMIMKHHAGEMYEIMHKHYSKTDV